MTGVLLINADIDGAIDGLVLNGVEVAPLISAELDQFAARDLDALAPDDAGRSAAAGT
jgi:hypothetical protein